jgi:hypothetical protein
MGSGRARAAGLRVAGLLVGLTLLCAGVAHADTFTWSAPLQFGNSIGGLACGSATQCAVVGTPGSEATFDPAAPGTLSPTPIFGHGTLGPLICSGFTECDTLITPDQAVAFSPTNPSPSSLQTIDSGPGAVGTGACISPAGECVAVDGNGSVVTFDPANPGAASAPIQVDTSGPGNHALTGVSCPSPSQCTAVDFGGSEVTFNPNAPAATTPTALGPGLTGVSCPSVSQCTASAGSGLVVTFDPDASPVTHSSATVDSQAGVDTNLVGVSCPTVSQCTVLDAAGRETTFDPQSPASPVPVPELIAAGAQGGIDCPSATECLIWDATTGAIWIGKSAGSGALGGGGGGGGNPVPGNPTAQQQQALDSACGAISGESVGGVLGAGGYSLGLNIDEGGTVTVQVTGAGGGIGTETYTNNVQSLTVSVETGGGVSGLSVGAGNGSIATYTGTGSAYSGGPGGATATFTGLGNAAADVPARPLDVWTAGLASGTLTASCGASASIADASSRAMTAHAASAHRKAKLCVRKRKNAKPRCSTLERTPPSPLAETTATFSATGLAHIRVPLTKVGRLELSAAKALDRFYKRRHKHAHSVPSLKLTITIELTPTA